MDTELHADLDPRIARIFANDSQLAEFRSNARIHFSSVYIRVRSWSYWRGIRFLHFEALGVNFHCCHHSGRKLFLSSSPVARCWDSVRRRTEFLPLLFALC